MRVIKEFAKSIYMKFSMFLYALLGSEMAIVGFVITGNQVFR